MAAISDKLLATSTRAPLGERRDRGRSAREATPRSEHASWTPSKDRTDPVSIITDQDSARLSWLVPIRHERMAASAFAYFRGTAAVMAADLATLPRTDLDVQLCGDAHLSNFGVYASPERQLVFDVNDFDETLPGPFEWDLKRLATSLTVAARSRGFAPSEVRSITASSIRTYQTAMTRYAGMNVLDVYYDDLPVSTLAHVPGLLATKKQRKRLERGAERARRNDNLRALRKLAVEVDGRYQLKSDPPLLFSLERLAAGDGDFGAARIDTEALQAEIEGAVLGYLDTLPDDRRATLARFVPMDFGLKVVGVGSVGTRCFVLLLEGRDAGDPLFLQVKEATTSVLEDHLGPSRYDHAGQRVVEGQRLVQAASDDFLGWTHDTHGGRHYYVRQLRDWKGSADVEHQSPAAMRAYAEVCGWTLARGHARSGDAVAIRAYLGKNSTFERAVTAFAAAYADQNDRDFEAFTRAIADRQR